MSVSYPWLHGCRLKSMFALQRRLLIGIGLTVAAGAFAVIPTSSLRGKPSKPLFFYLVPLLKIQVSTASAHHRLHVLW